MTRLTLGGAELVADPVGALWWPDERMLLVADLHLEKGTSFARRGTLLPPWDTRATLDRLDAALTRYGPEVVVALGDSFHDREARARLGAEDAARLAALTARCDWRFLAGNHDPGGTEEAFEHRGIVFRHEAAPGAAPEVSGHYHPKATIRVHGRAVACRCFVTDGRRLIMPAFGAYAGGLDVRDPAIADWFPDGFTAWLAGTRRLTAVPSSLLGVRPAAGEPAFAF
ncbi:MAG TPA: ligase-associated DNA damage response endonuclease PdeM [Stellaceae bacterium]|nr:ligase-associated DNA damage response endonuclease PdeM [Stellaceae bacterium]